MFALTLVSVNTDYVFHVSPAVSCPTIISSSDTSGGPRAKKRFRLTTSQTFVRLCERAVQTFSPFERPMTQCVDDRFRIVALVIRERERTPENGKATGGFIHVVILIERKKRSLHTGRRSTLGIFGYNRQYKEVVGIEGSLYQLIW